MKRCRTLDELRQRYGDPDHIIPAKDMEFWHYPLRAVGGFLYSIHVAVIDGRPDQTYLHMEPQDDVEGKLRESAR
jgi:hypothetical protein